MPLDPLARQKSLQTVKPFEHQNAYQSLYDLRENPFPSLALFSPNVNDPRRNGEIYDPMFRQAEEQRFFEMFVQPTNGDSPTKLGFIRLDPQAGGRGNGKSAFLHRIMQRINEQDWESWPTNPDDPNLFCLSVHVLPEPRKQRRFWEFVLLTFETLFEQGLLAEVDRQMRASVLLSLLSEDALLAISQLPSTEINQALASEEAYGHLLEQYGFTLQGFVELARSQVAKVQPTSNAYLEHYYTNNCSLETAWITWRETGMLASAFQWRKNGVEWLTDGLVAVLLAAGYQRLIILLDEFEKIYISQSNRERDEFLDGLRQYFYERPSIAVKYQFVTMVLTIHPSIYTYVSNNWRRVGLDNMAPLDVDRIEQVSVELGASNIEKLTHLLVYYIDWFRTDPDDPRKGTVYPFSEEALPPIINAARYYPRGTLWYAHRILQKAAKEGEKAPIGLAFIEDFLTGGEKPSQEADDLIFQLPPTQNDLQV
jgi:hypothetical protein